MSRERERLLVSVTTESIVTPYDDLEIAYSNHYHYSLSKTYVPTKVYKRNSVNNNIREAMVRGYEEMSQINLEICSECIHLEYEAEHTVERRLV